MKTIRIIFISVVLLILSTAICFSLSDSQYEKQWYLHEDEKFGIQINRAKDLVKEKPAKKELIIAIIDTGINFSHEDLDERFWINKDEIAGNGIDDDGNGYIDDVYGWNFEKNSNEVFISDQFDHATHIAGIISANGNNETGVYGIASECNIKIMSLNIMDSQGGYVTADLVKAIKYAEDNGAIIVNLSLSNYFYSQELVDTIKASKMMFVCAAGNSGQDVDKNPLYPASLDYNNVISVANLQSDGKLNKSSNYGKHAIDIAAPGTNIFSTSNTGSYVYKSGTSMATPMVTASIAMLMCYNPNITAIEAKDIILKTAIQTDYLKGKVACGGYLSLGNAIEYLDANYYGDVTSNSEYFEAIQYLSTKKYMNGIGGNMFAPESNLTRAMVITILGRIAESSGFKIEDGICMEVFPDADYDSWYGRYLAWACKNNIIQGYTNGDFGPDDYIQAYQLNLILSRFAKIENNKYVSDLNGNRLLTRGETAIEIYKYLMAK